MRLSIFLSFTALLSVQAVDLNSDGLSDIWQQHFSAEALASAADNDGDGFTNEQESIAGTDPLSANEHPFQTPLWAGTGARPLYLEFQSEEGKSYQAVRSATLQNFTPFGPVISGNGGMITLTLSDEAESTQQGGVNHELWSDIVGYDMTTLTGLATFPAQPDGVSQISSFDIPQMASIDHGGRVYALITPPQTGDYTFYLSAGATANLLLSSDASSINLTTVAQVLLAHEGINPGEFDKFQQQTSSEVSLNAGNSYLLEMRYLASIEKSHCQAAWSGPGISGSEIIGASALAPAMFLPDSVREKNLFLHNYDTAGQTGTLWTTNTAIVSASAGMSGNAESFVADPTQDLVTLPESTDEHFYATFLFQMNTGHRDLDLYFRNADTGSQDGPRIDMEDSTNGTVAVIRPDGSSAVSNQIVVTFDQVYRIEIVASLVPGGFKYRAGLETLICAEDTFDIYVSNTNGKLVGRTLGVAFRDKGADLVQKIDAVRAGYVNQPNVYLDQWEITAGNITGNGYLTANTGGFEGIDTDQFYRVAITDSDQDGDGLSDWEEMMLGKHQSFLFFDSETINGSSDLSAATSLLNSATGPVEISLQASDTAAFERNSPNLSEDHGEITLTRTGPLTAITVNLCQEPLANTGNTATICDGTCCSLIGSAGDEAAEVDDYILVDENGEVISNQVTFAFGEMTKKLTIIATPDSINEYPETLNLALEADEAGSYQISATNGASIQLFDLPEHPENVALFTGMFSQDGNATIASNGTGFTTATLNGPRTQILFYNEFSNLTSVQQDSHIHKSNAGPAPGAIIYAITETPGDETTDPLNGPLTAYPWDLTVSSGAVPTSGGAASKQVIIDSLFNQNSESPLYLNIHTIDNPAGEIWAFLVLSGGSQSEPEDPPGSSTPGSVEYPQLTGEDLESEVRRFLNQATFGATDDEVNSMVAVIENERLADASYHRHEAYEIWIDSQMDEAKTPQSYLLDYNMASDLQFYKLAGSFDPIRNPSTVNYTTPVEPMTYPTIDRTNPDSEKWHLSGTYPISRNDLRLIDANNLQDPDNKQRRHTHWQMMLNAKDQLRQKTGFALQQIVVISASEDEIEDNMYGAANYQDQLNHHAFDYYRDVLGFVNWSPLMGKWLSSLQNQKGADLDGDGNDDIFPDENLAREDMQLFSIGLFELWPDGSLRLGNDGLPIPTYNNNDIREFAKVLTGQSFGQYNSTTDPWGGTPYDGMVENAEFNRGQNTDGRLTLRYSYPMKMFGEYHDTSVKTFAGTVIDNTHLTDPTAQGIADIEQAVDWLAGKPGNGQPDFDMVNSHRSVPAFISRRLIQRFTTSNPSKDYLHRVAKTFKDHEGDLGLTIKAILLDSEARVPDFSNATFGIKKSPVEGYLQVARSLEAITHLPIRDPAGAAPFDNAPGTFTNPDLFLANFGLNATQVANQDRNFRFNQGYTLTTGITGLQMVPFRQETVFNFYLPDYAPGGPIADAGLVSPELQLANEQDVIRNINYFEDIARGSFGVGADNLADSTTNQQLVLAGGSEVNNNDRIRLDRDRIAVSLYPATPPTATAERTSESLADEILIDELDRRLTLGYLKAKYPYDPSDDDDPNTPGVDDFLKNPRELIIDAITFYGNPWSGTNDLSDMRNKLSDAVYLISFTPEFQIKK